MRLYIPSCVERVIPTSEFTGAGTTHSQTVKDSLGMRLTNKGLSRRAHENVRLEEEREKNLNPWWKLLAVLKIVTYTAHAA